MGCAPSRPSDQIQPGPPTPIMNLPNEILQQIFEEVIEPPDIECVLWYKGYNMIRYDAYHVGVVCKRFAGLAWLIAQRRLREVDREKEAFRELWAKYEKHSLQGCPHCAEYVDQCYSAQISVQKKMKLLRDVSGFNSIRPCKYGHGGTSG